MTDSELKVWNEAIEAAIQAARLADIDELYGGAGNRLRREIVDRIRDLAKTPVENECDCVKCDLKRKGLWTA